MCLIKDMCIGTTPKLLLHVTAMCKFESIEGIEMKSISEASGNSILLQDGVICGHHVFKLNICML